MFWLRLTRSRNSERIARCKLSTSRSFERTLELESLESRITPTILLVNTANSFLSQLVAATPGSTLQIEPGAKIGTVNSNSGTVVGTASAGSTTILSNSSFSPGQIIAITTGGNVDTVLVDSVTPVGGSFSLALNAPLAHSHNNSDPIVPVANELGIDKDIIIAGDPALPPSALFAGTTIEYFPQNGASGSAALRNLSLTAVSGTSGGNLNIVDDNFNIASGTTTPIAVESQGELSIDNNTFSVGSSASLSSVVFGETNAGSITLDNDNVTVSGKVGLESILLFSNSGPISLSNDNLKVAGTGGDNGIAVMTAGNATVNSTTVNLNGAATGAALDVAGANCALSNITITGAASLEEGLEVAATGDLSLTGTNSVIVTGPVTTGVDLSAKADVVVANLTAQFKQNVSQDAVEIDTPALASLSAINLTVVGSVGGNGVDVTNSNNGVGSLSLNAISVLLDSSAVDGFDALTIGNINVAGTESVTVAGAVSDDGMELSSQDGNISVAAGLSLKLGSSAENGLQVVSSKGNLNIVGPLVVLDSGAVTDDGVSLTVGNLLYIGVFTVTLDSTAEFGIEVQAGDVLVTGPLNLKAIGAVASNGVIIESNTDATFVDPITVTLESNALIGLDIEVGGTLSIAGEIDLNVNGSATNGGILLGGDQTIQLGPVNINIAGGAGYGLEIESGHGSVIATSGIAVDVVGMTDGTVDGIVTASAAISATLSNVKVTASSLANEAGLAVAAGSGLLSVSNIQIIASGGTSSTGGIDLNSSGSVAVTGVSISIKGQTDFGLKVHSQFISTVTNATITVSGSVLTDGIDIDSQGAVNLDGVSETLQKSVGGDGIDVTGTSVVVSGPMAADIVGAVADEGISLNTSAGNMSITAPISINLGSTASYGVNFDAIDSILDSSALTVNVAGNVGNAGASLEAGKELTFGGNTKVSLGGTAQYGLNATASNGALNNTAPITVSVAGQIADAGATFTGAAAINNLNVNLSKGSSEDGLDLSAPAGNITLTNTTLKITGPVTGTGLSLTDNQGNISTSNLNINLSSSVGNGIEAASTTGNLTMLGTALAVSGNVSATGATLGAGSSLNLQSTNVTLKGTSSNAFAAGGGTLTVGGLNLQESGAINDLAVEFESSSGNSVITSSSIALGSTTNVGLSATSQGDETISGLNFKEAGFATTVGIDLESQGNLSATGDNFSFVKGSGGSVAEVNSFGGSVVVNKDSFAANATVSAGLEAQAIGSLTLENTSIVLNAGATTAADLIGYPQIVENNTFSTSGQGTGVMFLGGASCVALVQGNNFQNNQLGVEIYGDGTNAGDIDLGGGLLGSLGGNNFKGFTGISGSYAIELTNTNSTSTVYAAGNIFSVTNPLTVLQDSTHNSNGTGTGIIDL